MEKVKTGLMILMGLIIVGVGVQFFLEANAQRPLPCDDVNEPNCTWKRSLDVE